MIEPNGRGTEHELPPIYQSVIHPADAATVRAMIAGQPDAELLADMLGITERTTP